MEAERALKQKAMEEVKEREKEVKVLQSDVAQLEATKAKYRAQISKLEENHDGGAERERLLREELSR